MKLAKVIGTIAASQKCPAINHLKILVVQPLDETLNPSGDAIAAIDTVQAGPNDIVYLTLARESAFALPQHFAPVDAAITGIVDHIHLDQRPHQPSPAFLSPHPLPKRDLS